jgi:hypothetical protein
VKTLSRRTFGWQLVAGFLAWFICSEHPSGGVGKIFVSMKELSFRQPRSR